MLGLLQLPSRNAINRAGVNRVKNFICMLTRRNKVMKLQENEGKRKCVYVSHMIDGLVDLLIQSNFNIQKISSIESMI